ncbi:MAG TPA: hypothetical protein VFB70_14420 [Pyrinomonadaceae bacterium]|nr:hypothetical protein [Pyrinomonadaceae bacterium]
MRQHPTKLELQDYRRRTLAPDVFLSVQRHVADCASCAMQSDSPADLARDLEDLHSGLLDAPDETPYHLSTVEAMAYARNTADEIDSEIAESHLAVCEACRAEVQRHHVKPPALKPRAWVNWWQPLRVAAVVSCGILVILLVLWLLRNKPAQHTEQAVSPPPATSSPQSSPAPSATPEVRPTEFALVLNDGTREVTVDKQGTLAGLERLPSPLQQRVRAALQSGKLEHPSALVQLKGQPSTLLGKSSTGLPFELVSPLAQVVRTEQPTFRWRPLAGAQSYTVTVTDADLNVVATSPPLNTTEWRISNRLRDGVVYSWQVTAQKDGAGITSPVLPAPQAKFKVIDRATSETLQQAERAYPDSHLTLGVLYAEAGLLDEAEQQLRELVRSNPRERIAIKLLDNVKALRVSASGGFPQKVQK